MLSSVLSAQTFTSTNYTVGTNPQKLIRADVNGDGAIDLITANSDGSVTILLNNGNGTFHRVDAVGGTALTDIAAADFNKDGHQDLVVLNQTATTTELNLLTGRGDGTFNAPVTIDAKVGGAAIAVGDFNHDGKTDIAFGWNQKSTVVNPASGGFDTHANVTIYFGDGTGAFPTHKDMLSIGAQADYANGESGYQIRVMNSGDFNHDGKTDFAIGECCGGSDVELGSAAAYLSNGDGTFGEHILYSSIPNELRVGDIEGNGTTDLLIPYHGCHSPCNGVTAYRNVATSPSGLDLPDFFGNGSGGITDHAASATVGAFNGPGTRVIAYTGYGFSFDPGSTEQGMLAFATVNGSGYTLQSTIDTSADVLAWITSGDFNKDSFDDLAGIVQSVDWSGTVTQVRVLTNKGAGGGSCSATSNRTVNICSPTAGATVTSPVQVLAAVRSDAGVSAAQIYVDGTKVFQGPAGTTTVNQSLTLSLGTHRITVKGWDSAGSFSSSITVNVAASRTCSASANRTVTICSPTAGSTVPSPVQVQAGLRSDAGISAAQIYLDGTKVFQGPAGTTFVNQSISMAVGSHRVTVKGWDSAGSFSSSVNFTVH
jgi:FG-GAP-like repeat/Bacterial Ig domain/FG-GAP repeat